MRESKFVIHLNLFILLDDTTSDKQGQGQFIAAAMKEKNVRKKKLPICFFHSFLSELPN